MIVYVASIFLLLSTYIAQADYTFLTIRPPFQSGSPERLALTHDQLKWFDKEARSIIQVCPFVGTSTNPDSIARYFLPFNKTCLNVGEFGSEFVAQNRVDVIANYFGIYTAPLPVAGAPIEPTLSTYTFQSTLSFKPKHTFAGLGLVYHYHISPCLDKGFWIEFSTPIMYVRNTMGMCENIITPGGPNGDDPAVPAGYQPNMTQAFKQGKFLWGRIEGPASTWGLADIEAKLGYTYGTGCNYHLDTYVGLHIPTAPKINNEVVFEPVIGQNQQLGIFAGTVAGFKIWENCDSWISLELETVGKLFLENHEERSINLYGKDWGRYIWIYTNENATTPNPGINVFTQLSQVSPGATRDLNSALVYGNPHFQIELGYHFFSREKETISLDKCFKITPAIAGIWNTSGPDAGTFVNPATQGVFSRNGATINNYAGILNDTTNGAQTYLPIQLKDFNTESAGTPATITHTIYLTLGYHGSISRYDSGFNIGASYEYGKEPGALDRVLVWAKWDISY